MNKFCILPWVHTEIRPNGDLMPCCMFKGQSNFNIKNTTLHKYSKTYLKELREKFINNQSVYECSNCWDEEKLGLKSKRQRSNELFNNVNKVPENFNLRYLDLKLGNTCNLKCRICSSLYSSKWIADELKLLGKSNSSKEFNWSKLIDDKFLTDHVKNVEQIDFTGGEPFLIEKHFKLLEYLNKNNLSQNVKIHYNTNGTIEPTLYQIELLEKFKYVEVMFSIDDIGKRFEYIRHPAIWEILENNFYNMLKTKLNVSICFTLSIYNILYFDEFINWFNTLNLSQDKLFINILHSPIYLKPSSLPNSVKNRLLEKYKDSNYNFITKSLYTSGDWQKFKEYTKSLDKIRNENFIEIFDKFKEFWYED